MTAVTVHGTELPEPVAIQVRGVPLGQRVGRALGSIDASWPEHYHWAMRAFDRGDFWVTQSGPGVGDVWFFEGEDGEALAGL